MRVHDKGNGITAAVLVVSSLVCGAQLTAQQRYGLTAIAPLAPHQGSLANDINESGIVVGWSGTLSGYVWIGESARALPALAGGGITRAEGVNRRGAIVGSSDSATASDHAVVWMPDAVGGYTVIDLGVASGDVFSVAKAISLTGAVTGDSDDGFETQAVHWEPLGQQRYAMTVLPPLPNETSSYAEGVDPSGTIVVGASVMSALPRAVAWTRTDGVWSGRLLARLPGGSVASVASAVNAIGVITGWAADATGVEHAVLWYGSSILDLGTLGGRRTFPAAINAAGDVVGYTFSSIGQDRAFVRLAHDGVLRDLNDLVPGVSWRLVAATGINDRGQISGYGVRDGFVHSFALAPATVASNPGISVVIGPSIVVTVSGGSPLQPIFVFGSSSPESTLAGSPGVASLSLQQPLLVGVAIADASGTATLSLSRVDRQAAAEPLLLLQAFDPAAGRVSAVSDLR